MAVIEAGLGGRYDATNVIDSRVAVLTNVGLEHTRWLGPTINDIAGEKLAVVGADSTLVLGAGLRAARSTRWREAWPPSASARASCRPTDGHEGEDLDAARRRALPAAQLRARPRVAAAPTWSRGWASTARGGRATRPPRTTVPGRFQRVGEDPPTLFDGAHNPAGIAALAESLPDFTAGRPLGVVLGVLEDKDAAGMLRALLPSCRARLVHRRRQPARAASADAGIARPPARLRASGWCCEADAQASRSPQARGWAAGDGRRGAGDRFDLPCRRPAWRPRRGVAAE